MPWPVRLIRQGDAILNNNLFNPTIFLKKWIIFLKKIPEGLVPGFLVLWLVKLFAFQFSL
jgi:hypothetical protein